MDLELVFRLKGKKRDAWQQLLQQEALTPDENADVTVLLWDGEILAGTASRLSNLVKCVAVDSRYQGQGLTAQLLTVLRQDGAAQGISHLFLYTKPKNEHLFRPLFFYPVAQSPDVLLMENRKDGITEFLRTLPKAEVRGKIGSIVANCNPFTLGHRYLIETASRQCDHLYVFVLSEDKSLFSFADRMEMVKLGTADLKNVTVLPTGPYLISAVTFPTYFLKETAPTDTIQCALDCEIFGNHYAKHFGITTRFVGTEPNCPVTAAYNEAMKQILPSLGVEVVEIPRKNQEQQPISASRVRQLLQAGAWDELEKLVPPTTYAHLKNG